MSYRLFIMISFMFVVSSCMSQTVNDEKEIMQMTSQLCIDLQSKGPIAWRDYFEENKNFFMVNDGKIVFANNNAAKNFITDTLTKIFTKINLFLTDIKVDMLSESIAVIASPCHEVLYKANAGTLNFDGYLTAVIDKVEGKWKFRNLHWSSEKK